MLKEWKKRIEDKRYKQCKEIVEHPDFVYDLDILLFVALYEEIQRLENKYQKVEDRNFI